MPSFPRYQTVPQSDDDDPSDLNRENLPSHHTVNEARGNNGLENESLTPPKPEVYAPPPYSECGSDIPLNDDTEALLVQPPSYEEVQLLKAQEAAAGDLPPYCSSHRDPESNSRGNGVQVVRISPLNGLDPQAVELAEEQLLGTDVMFFVSFAVAFIFNWLGFMLLLCFCHTVAGRTGALSGFGLSLAKWAVIVRHSTDLIGDSNSWLLWVIMILGLLICMRAILQYLHAKREWQNVPNSSRNRFFFFY